MDWYANEHHNVVCLYEAITLLGYPKSVCKREFSYWEIYMENFQISMLLFSFQQVWVYALVYE